MPSTVTPSSPKHESDECFIFPSALLRRCISSLASNKGIEQGHLDLWEHFGGGAVPVSRTNSLFQSALWLYFTLRRFTIFWLSSEMEGGGAAASTKWLLDSMPLRNAAWHIILHVVLHIVLQGSRSGL